MTVEEFKQIATSLPSNPGIYKYFDVSKELLYVGKAKNIRKRVSSYFTKTQQTYKTYELVNRIAHIEFTIVDTEQDAFLLENSLIKQFQPRFNINLKDDKTYPFIVIKKEPFPRIFLTRRKINDGSTYLGPFTSAGKVRDLLSLIKQNIPIRTCKLSLTDNNIAKGKFKVCLEYHLGNCKGPCESLQSKEDYEIGLMQVKNLLKGNLSSVIQYLKKRMQEEAAVMAFEKAMVTQKKIEHLQEYQASSVIVSKHLTHIDVFTIDKETTNAYVNYLSIENGTIVQTHTIELETRLDETVEEVLAFAIAQLRETFNSTAQEIVIPFSINWPYENTSITVPKAGEKKKLLDLSAKNVTYFRSEKEKEKRLHLGNAATQITGTLLEIKELLHLQTTPTHIECFDNSNFQGSYPVSAMVCFKNGEPSKKDYRHFKVKDVVGINDFATMKEVVGRRYKRLKEENQPFPQLVIIDGGKGQLSAAVSAIEELGLNGQLTLVGLAKNEEELFFANDQQSLKLNWNSNALKLIRHIRDEVHRFGITFHRQLRSKGTIRNELENIKGIGEQTANDLLRSFKSVKKIKEASLASISEIIGVAKAKLVRDYFDAIDKNVPLR